MSENTLFIAEGSCEKSTADQLAVGLDDLILTQDMPTSAGSKMLAGFKSLFAARVDERLREAGCHVAGKVNIGEFGFDFLGETSYFGPVTDANGNLTTAASQLLADGRVDAVVETPCGIYVFEFKLNGTASAALAQIKEKGYHEKYLRDGRKVTLAGVAFDAEMRNLSDRQIEVAADAVR